MADVKSQYTKSVQISFDADKSSFDKIRKMVEGLGIDLGFDLLDKNSISDLKKLFDSMKESGGFRDVLTADEQLRQLKEYDQNIVELTKRQREFSRLSTEEAKAEVERLGAKIQEYENAKKELGVIEEAPAEKEDKTFKDNFKEQFKKIKENLKDDFSQVFGFDFNQHIVSVLNKVKNFIIDSFTGAWDEMNNILKYSRLSDAQVREQSLAYGFSASQNYAFDKIKDFFGISDLTDVMFMSAQEQEKFYEKFNEYGERYNQLYDKGFFNELQEFNWEIQEFKEDIQYELIDFFMENKETIKDIFHAVIDVGKFLVDALGKILSVLGKAHERTESERLAAFNEMWGLKSSTSNTTNNTNVNVSNNFTNVSNSDKTWLANAGTLTYEQIIQALT